jgi:hypothetical protein
MSARSATHGLLRSPMTAIVAVGALLTPATHSIPNRASSSRIAAAVFTSS